MKFFPPPLSAKPLSSYRSNSAGSTSSTCSKRNGKRIDLGPDFVPADYSVICGRGKVCSTSDGNRFLKSLVMSYLKPYSEAKNKVEKSTIVSAIIARVKKAAPGGAFVKYDEDTWWEVDDAFAREKIGCLFRDCLHTQYRSSTKAKLARRKVVKRPSPEDCSTLDGSDHSSAFAPSFVGDLFGPQDIMVPTDIQCVSMNAPSDHPVGTPQQIQSNGTMAMSPQQILLQNGTNGCSSLPFEAHQQMTPLLSQYLQNHQRGFGEQNNLFRQATSDFSHSVMPNPLPIQNQNIASIQPSSPSISSDGALREACALIRGNLTIDDEFPDDLSDIFDS